MAGAVFGAIATLYEIRDSLMLLARTDPMTRLRPGMNVESPMSDKVEVRLELR